MADRKPTATERQVAPFLALQRRQEAARAVARDKAVQDAERRQDEAQAGAHVHPGASSASILQVQGLLDIAGTEGDR